LFLPQNASFIEFGLTPLVDRSFGYMAMALGLDYWMVPQVTSFLFGHYGMDEARAQAVVELLRHVLHHQGLEGLIKDGKGSRTPSGSNVAKDEL
jgi:hypothetical protein